jgi:hypothetical protein
VISQQLLVPKLERDFAADVVQLIRGVGKERLTTADLHQTVDHGPAVSTGGEICVWIYDANYKNLNILLLHEFFDVREGIAAMVVLIISDQ